MATLKPTVKSKLKTGMYIVYIRVVQNRQSSFIRTSWMVNDKGIKGKDVIDPFVVKQTSNLISSYYNILNQIDISGWTVSEVVSYLTISTRRHLLSLESGRVSIMRTRSPMPHSLFSSCALNFTVRLMIFL